MESRLPGEISITSDDTTLIAESEEEQKSLLMKVKEESEKAGLKLNIKINMKIMASGPITSWEMDGETVETVSDFILGGSKITVFGLLSKETSSSGVNFSNCCFKLIFIEYKCFTMLF